MLARLEAFDRHILRSNHKDADVTIEAGLGRSWTHCRIFRSYHPYPLLLAFEIYYTKKRFEHKPEVVVLVCLVLIHVFRNIVCGEPTILASLENLAVSIGRCELPFDRKGGWSHAVLQVAWCIQVAMPHPVWTYYYDVFMMQAVWFSQCSVAPGPGFRRFEASISHL